MSARSSPAAGSGRTERTSVRPATGEPSAGLPCEAAAASCSPLSTAMPSAVSARIPPSTSRTEWPVTSMRGTVALPGEVSRTVPTDCVVARSHSTGVLPNPTDTGASIRADASLSARSDRYQRAPNSAATTSPTRSRSSKNSEHPHPRPRRPPPRRRLAAVRSRRPMGVWCRTRVTRSTVSGTGCEERRPPSRSGA